jgi:hypothetical protein
MPPSPVELAAWTSSPAFCSTPTKPSRVTDRLRCHENYFDPTAHALSINRRSFLTQSAYGLGGLALAMLQNKSLAASLAGPRPARRDPAHWNGALQAAHCP